MSARRIRRLPILIVAFGALAILLGGCVGIKPGTFKLTQPAGIGPVNMQIAVCTLQETEPEPKVIGIACGPAAEPAQEQLLATLVVPVGAVPPLVLKATPGPGAAPTAFIRNPELTAQMNARELTPGTTGPPPGFELAGYSSGVVSESVGQEFTWTIEAGIGLPPGAGGGSYGGPLKVTTIIGTRSVTAERPASRPMNCNEEKPEEGTFCGGPEANGELTLGVSDLKIANPAPASAVPGAKLKIPFVFDFASSAAELPKFKLAVISPLPGAELSLSNSTFTRGPSEAGTNRAPPTTRKAIVQVPETAPFGSYELSLTATAAQGGATSAATTISVKPKGRAKVTVPKLVTAKAASKRGIPVKLTAPIAGTRFQVVLRGPRPSGRGSVRLRRKVSVAKALGTTTIRLRIPRSKAEEFLEEGATLLVQTRIDQPGVAKPKKVVGTLKLR